MTVRVVGWQYRVSQNGKHHVDWKPWEREDRPAKIGRWDAEYRAVVELPAVIEALEDAILRDSSTALIHAKDLLATLIALTTHADAGGRVK